MMREGVRVSVNYSRSTEQCKTRTRASAGHLHQLLHFTPTTDFFFVDDVTDWVLASCGRSAQRRKCAF